MGSKYVDTTSILQVIGCVYNDPSLLDQTEKYTITEEDFPNSFHKVVFGAIYNIYFLGASKINLKNVLDFLAQHPKSEAIFKKEKGEEWLVQAADNATASAFDYYYNRLKKMSLLRAFDNNGIDVSRFYDPDNIFDTKKKQAQEEWLNNTDITEIANKIVEEVDRIVANHVNQTFGEAQKPDDGAFELREKLKQHPDVGVPLYGPLINTVTRGARLRKLYLRSAPSGYGKAIPNYIEIPTPKGARKVGDIRVGDYLFGQNGKPTKVVAVHPQLTEKEIWEVTFSDGRKAECCGEHLWEYSYRSHQGWAYRTEDIKTIYERNLRLKNGFKNSNNEGFRFHIKINQPLEYSEKNYSLDPYLMGAFLGDGCFREKNFCFASDDADMLNLIIQALGSKYYYTKNPSNCTYLFKRYDNPKHPIWTEEFLKDFPELWQAKSETKFIPQKYLYGSIKQRYSLLQGLMDTDGCIDKKGRTSFTTTSPQMRDDVINLCRSLGFIATYSADKRGEKYTGGQYYQVHIQCKKALKPKLFRLQRKIDIAKKYAQTAKREEYKNHIAIINIEKTTKRTAMTCFTVEAEDHLFLMNDYIVTHNTRTMIADVCYIGCDEIYDETFGWIKNGTAEPVLYITTEQELEEIQTMMWAFIANVDEDHIMNNKYEGDEEARIDKAIEILKRSKIYIIELPDFSLRDVENLIRQNIREHGIRYAIFDYLMSSLKILEEIAGRAGGVKLREDNILFMLSRRLKDLANEYGIFILSATQLNGDWRDSETPDQSLLRGAKSIADSIDLGMHILPTTKKDLEGLETILATNAFDTPDVKISVYKNRRGRYKGVYLWAKANYGTCRFKPIFATTWGYEILKINDLKIITEEEGAF